MRSRASNFPRATCRARALFAAALHRGFELAAQVRDQRLHRLGVAGEFAELGSMVGGKRSHRWNTRTGLAQHASMNPLTASSRTARRPINMRRISLVPGADLIELGVAQIAPGRDSR